MPMMTMSPFNQGLWDVAFQKATDANYSVLTEYESKFITDLTEKQKVLAEAGLPFRPTVKQFNFLRELARKI